MIIEKKTMNILFYLGIILPTIITVILFLLFILCWYRLRARREIINKKHDPHGKMRQLGMSFVPPPPPVFVHRAFHRLPAIGEDNDAYQVSRSPSTEQELPGRPGLYHVQHDSGLSELGEFQCKDRPHSQASQGSTDSEDSGFRSSRSGQYHPSANNQLQDVPLLKPIKTNRQSSGDNTKHSPCEMAQPSDWNTSACARTFNSSGRNFNSSARNFNVSDKHFIRGSKNLNSSGNLNSSSRTIKSSPSVPGMDRSSRQVDLNDISTHLSWMCLQNVAASSTANTPYTMGDPRVTLAQIHCSSARGAARNGVESNNDLLGFSVV